MIKSKIKKLKVKKEKKDTKKEPTDSVSLSNVTSQPAVVTVVSLPPQSTGATESSPLTELTEAPKDSPAPGDQVKKKLPKKPKTVSKATLVSKVPVCCAGGSGSISARAALRFLGLHRSFAEPNLIKFRFGATTNNTLCVD